jgi:hypothetical protein
MAGMRSVADRLREEDRRNAAAVTAAARVAVALALGRRDLAAFRSAAPERLDPAEAARRLERRRQAGRRPSRCHADIIG